MAIELNQRLTLAATSDHRLTVTGAQRSAGNVITCRAMVEANGLSIATLSLGNDTNAKGILWKDPIILFIT